MNYKNWEPLENMFVDLFGVADDLERGFATCKPHGKYRGECRSIKMTADMNDDIYTITAELPGITQDDIEISFNNGIVKITAEYKEDGLNPFKSGTYSRQLKLLDIDAEKAEAALKDGILTITLPRAEEKKSRKININ